MEEAEEQQVCQRWRSLLLTYSLILVYIVFDAVRNLVLQKALAATAINSNSMGLMIYVIGAFLASALTLYTDGLEGLKQAWSPRKILRCLPAGFLFALTTMLSNMAYSLGMSAALALVLGKFYTPVAAVGARWVLGKYYMWLEYVAIAILTLASVVFGYLQVFGPDVKQKSGLAAMMLVLGAATTAAFNSLITEKILKGEQVSFHLQKVRLDVSSIISTIVLIPLVGLITSRPQEIPWVTRPESYSCPAASVCWKLSEHTCAHPACTCHCDSGVFAGWTSQSIKVILLALVINTVYGWLVGKLVQSFSTLHRAIADSFSLLVIYFVGDPLLNHSNLSNMSLNLVAFIVPLSTGIFAVAASEMQKVMEATIRIHSHNGARGEKETADRKKLEALANSALETHGEFSITVVPQAVVMQSSPRSGGLISPRSSLRPQLFDGAKAVPVTL